MFGIKKNEKYSSLFCRKAALCRKECFMEQKLWSDYNELQEQLRGVLSTLAPLEQDVLKMRFGLDDGKSQTIKEGCERFGMTRLEGRTVEAKTLRRLRRGNNKV